VAERRRGGAGDRRRWLLLLIVAAAIISVLESRRLAYQVREHDLSLRRGVIRHVVETIPYSRVQHVNVGRGLVERSLGLATLVISSAGPDISVPGLAVADADRIKQVIAQRAGVDDESERPEPGAVSAVVAATSGPPASRIMIDLTQPQRQSPVAVVLLGVGAIRSLGIAQIAIGDLLRRRGAADGRLVSSSRSGSRSWRWCRCCRGGATPSSSSTENSW
jgi:uncharacterized membrane protein YdbT with pleckstrin-like domain